MGPVVEERDMPVVSSTKGHCYTNILTDPFIDRRSYTRRLGHCSQGTINYLFVCAVKSFALFEWLYDPSEGVVW